MISLLTPSDYCVFIFNNGYRLKLKIHSFTDKIKVKVGALEAHDLGNAGQKYRYDKIYLSDQVVSICGSNCNPCKTREATTKAVLIMAIRPIIGN